MKVGSLFAGIGGFELAAQWAGLEPIWSNEIDPYCCNVLRKNFNHEINTEWDQNELIGVRQSGDQSNIGLFSEGGDNNDIPNDFKDPRETVILTKIVD